MESIIPKLKSKLDNLQEKIDSREMYFGDKSEKWQESEKGEAYSEKTSEMEDLHQNIEFEVDQIESCLESLRELSDQNG